tara:strand:+ start:1207 stop:2271 length:1065 start_codon:yes stop_codon:yes gene_type:complete
MPYALFNGSYISKRNTGIGVVAKNLIKFLSRDLFSILDPLDDSSVGSIAIPTNLSPEYGIRGHLRRLFWLETSVKTLMKKSGAEFFISPLPEIPLFSSVRSIVIAHDLIPLRFPSLSLLTAYNLTYMPAVFSKSELILCNSMATAQEINQFFGIPFSKLQIIRLGFDKSNLYPLNLDRENFFLILGRHNPHKNLDRIIRSFALIPDQSYKLVFVGPSDHRYTPKLHRLIKELHISDRCIWKGWISDEEKLVLLNKCKALLMISLWEGFGLPALEAMACGTPVIASNIGALKELVGNTGYLVDPYNIHSISSILKEIIHDSKLLENASHAGPKRASMYNWEETSKQIEKILISRL